MNPASNYATGLSYEDDGRGQIQCPKKGLMAIQRCRQLQRETAEAGASCRCSVYMNYVGGEPDRDVGRPAPEEQLCGREVTESLDVQIGRLQKQNNRPIKPAPNNEVYMATHSKDARLCEKCGEPSPGDTRVFNGLCKPCREAQRKAEREVKRIQKKSAGKELEKIIVKHTQPAVATKPAAPAATDRQQMLPAVATQEIANLKRLVEDRDRDLVAMKHELDRVKWIAYGVRNGYEPIDRLVEIEEKPRRGVRP